MTPDPTLIEQVRGIVNEFLQARLAMDVSNYQIACVSEEIANAVAATLQGSAALPSEAMIERLPSILPPAADVDERYLEGWVDAMVYAQGCLRATTPTAPDQDTGASANADQALAVPVEPVARLDPPGFDPSRTKLLPAPRLVKALWAIFMRIDMMPKSNKNMGLDVWTMKTLHSVREAIDLASAIEARSAETGNTDSARQGESAAPQEDAHD